MDLNYKLERPLKNLREFATKHLQDLAYTDIVHQLDAITRSAAQKKLLLKIVFQDPSRAQAIEDRLISHSELIEQYQFYASSWPTQEFKEPSPILEYQANDASKNEISVHYPLDRNSSQIVGRNPAGATILIDDRLNLVSGCHAETHFFNNSWQIRDLDSRNGTFVNGSRNRLNGWHRLQTGDRISLGSATNTIGSAILTFKSSKEEMSNAFLMDEMSQLLDCNVLCLVIDALPELLEKIKSFSEKANRAKHLVKVIILGTKEHTKATGLGVTSPSFNDLKIWIEQQCFEIPIELSYPGVSSDLGNPKRTLSTSDNEDWYDLLCDSLTNTQSLRPRKISELQVGWAGFRINQLVDGFEQVFEMQSSTINKSIETLKAKTQGSRAPNRKESLREVQNKIKNDKDWLFKQTKNELSQSKASILNELKKSSISYQVQCFVDSLTTHTAERNGYFYLKLITDDGSRSIHNEVMRLIQSSIIEWAQAEWGKVCETYVDAGLKGLIEMSKKRLDDCSDNELPSDFFKSPDFFDPRRGLQDSLVVYESESRYQKQNIWRYIFRNLQRQSRDIVGLAAVSSTMFLVSRQQILSFLQPVILPASSIVLPGLIIWLWRAFRKEQEESQAKEEEKLKRDTLSHYQSVAKDSTEQVFKNLSLALDVEERKFRESLEQVEKFYTRNTDSTNQDKRDIERQLREYETQLRQLERDKVSLQRLRLS